MKIYIVSQAHIDSCSCMDCRKPVLFINREDAIKYLEDIWNKSQDSLSTTMDSDFDPDLGTLDIYDDRNEYSTYELTEHELDDGWLI